MQARLAAGGAGDLYGYWKDAIYRELYRPDGESGRRCKVLNLASKEYSKAVEPWLKPGDEFVTHKIHGPKGIGVLYIDEHVKIKPIVFGGEQQKNVRSGTENVPGIAGIGLAAKMIYENLDEKVAAMRAMKEHFIEGVKQIPDTTIHGLYDETSAPHIISVGFAGIRSEVLLHALEDKGIYVSSGSACASNHPQISGVLKGIGAGQQFLDATLRFSLSEFNTMEEIDYTLDTLYNIVPMLRKYTRH